MKPKSLKSIVVFAALGIAVVLFVMPKLPPSAKEAQAQLREEPELEQIMLSLNLGEAPMQGILRLRDYADAHPESAQAQFYLGKFAVQSGQMDKATQRFQNVVDIDPERAEVWFELSGLYLSQRQFEQSLECAKKAREVNPELSDALFFEAAALEQLGDTVQALIVYEEFLPLAGDKQVQDAVEAAIKKLSQ